MIPLFKAFVPSTLMKPLQDTLLSGYIGQGKVVDEFERKLGKKLNNSWLLTTNSGTNGLHLIAQLLNINSSSEILACPLSCTASFWPFVMAGAKIIWCDIDPEDMTIDPEDVANKITENTSAIIAVHWGGYSSDVQKLKEIASDVPIIQDCAHAFGSTYQEKPVGVDPWCMFSFQAIKTLQAVDGGCITVPWNIHSRAKLLRWYGINRDVEPEARHELQCGLDIPQASSKYHMNDVNATIGLHNLKYVDSLLAVSRSNAAFYDRELKGVSGLTLTQQKRDRMSSYYLFTVRVRDRVGFCEKLFQRGISTSQVHARVDNHSCVASFKTELPNLDIVEKEQISIPVGWWVSRADRQYIVDVIKEGW